MPLLVRGGRVVALDIDGVLNPLASLLQSRGQREVSWELLGGGPPANAQVRRRRLFGDDA